MTTENRLEIALNKRKFMLGLVASLAFVAAGIWFIRNPEEFVNPYRSEAFVTGIGYGAIIFFGLCAGIIFFRLLNAKPGLVLDETGLHDHASFASTGLVRWDDIERVSIMKTAMLEMVMVQVKNPQEYIDRQTSALKKKTMRMNYKKYGTPISIAPNTLQISVDKLVTLLNERLRNRT